MHAALLALVTSPFPSSLVLHLADCNRDRHRPYLAWLPPLFRAAAYSLTRRIIPTSREISLIPTRADNCLSVLARVRKTRAATAAQQLSFASNAGYLSTHIVHRRSP